jgi:hypothetical protein
LIQKLTRKLRQPCLHVDLDDISDSKAVEIITSSIYIRQIKSVNVAAPHANKDPKIYEATKKIFKGSY